MVDQLKWNKIGVFALKLSEIIEIAENYRRLRRISHIHNFLSECQRLSLLLSGSQLFKTSITVFDFVSESKFQIIPNPENVSCIRTLIKKRIVS